MVRVMKKKKSKRERERGGWVTIVARASGEKSCLLDATIPWNCGTDKVSRLCLPFPFLGEKFPDSS